MGYRSEVGIALKKGDFNSLVSLAKEKSEEGYELLKYADKIVSVGEVVVIHFDWVKWYEGYDDVDFIMDYLHETADGYGFVEIGEEDSDITTEYADSEDGTTFYEYVEVLREVYVPDGEEIKILVE